MTPRAKKNSMLVLMGCTLYGFITLMHQWAWPDNPPFLTSVAFGLKAAILTMLFATLIILIFKYTMPDEKDKDKE